MNISDDDLANATPEELVAVLKLLLEQRQYVVDKISELEDLIWEVRKQRTYSTTTYKGHHLSPCRPRTKL